MSLRLVAPPSRRAAAPDVSTDAAALVDSLAELHGLMQRLAELVREKLDALRVAAADRLMRCAQEEAATLEAVLRNNQSREAILARLAQALHWPEIRTAPLREIAARLPQPQSSQITAKSVPLKRLAEELAEKGRLAADVARNLHAHVRAMFAQLAQASQEAVVYGRNGQPDSKVTRNWVDAVG